MLILRRRAMLAITSAKRRVRNLAEETASTVADSNRFGSHRGTGIRVASS